MIPKIQVMICGSGEGHTEVRWAGKNYVLSSHDPSFLMIHNFQQVS